MHDCKYCKFNKSEINMCMCFARQQEFNLPTMNDNSNVTFCDYLLIISGKDQVYKDMSRVIKYKEIWSC